MIEPDSHAVSQLEVGRELGDGRRLADARRAHEGDDPARADDGPDRRGNRDAELDRIAERRPNRVGMIELIRLEVLGDVPHQPASQDLGNIGLDQLRVGRNQRAGKLGEQVVDVSALAQGLDHRVQPAELLADPRLQGRPTLRCATWSAGPGRLATSSSGGHRVGRDHLDQRLGPETKEPPAADLARRQDQGVAAQVPPHSRQGLLHRLGAVGFRSHQHCLFSTLFSLVWASDLAFMRRPPWWRRWSRPRAPPRQRCPGSRRGVSRGISR